MTGFYDEIKASSGMYKFYSNGEWMESTSGKGVSILNPASNESVYQVQGEEECSLLHKMLIYFSRGFFCSLCFANDKTPQSEIPMPREEVVNQSQQNAP